MGDHGDDRERGNRSKHQGGGRPDEGFGDDQGTRVGRPDPGRVNAAPST